ncbi:MAG: hypothetical protein SO170_04195 [Butyribacter sp.]|nr:hypothetical protein [Butyribacter sp.]
MKKIARKKQLTILCSIILIFSMLFQITKIANASNITSDNYEYNSISKLKKEIHRMYRDNEISSKERKKLQENTSPDVKAKYAQQQIEMVFRDNNKLSEISLDKQDGNKASDGEIYTKNIDYGNGTKVKITIKDEAEKDFFEVLGNKISDITGTKVSAAESSAKVTKNYGNRCCSESFWIIIPIGSMTISMTNHYTLSSKGIKERYGESDAISLTVGGSVSEGDPYITDSVATKPGKSDTNMKCKFAVSFSATGISVKYNVFMYSTLKYISINKSKKTITLNQKFKTS